MTKVVELTKDVRFNPMNCIERFMADVKDGNVKPRRVIMIVDVEDQDELIVYLSGAGMNQKITILGMMRLAEFSLLAHADESGET